MAKLSKEDVLKLARLSRLQLTDEEISSFREEISSILGYIDDILQQSVEGIEPTSQVTGLVNVMRPDEVAEYQAHSAHLLKNVPASKDGYIKVRRMLS
jgi:aspartyl-tRNA(Asn)/glutamyl-tRNA(Gln) amidotransferase subunit C